METLDTNVVVRLAVEDDEAQSRLAETIWRQALAGGGVFLPKVVVVETVWVLRTAYRFDAGAISQTLRRLLEVEGVTVEAEDEIQRALSSFEQGSADLADYLILETARAAEALPVRTFDRRFAKETEVELVMEGNQGPS